jgi:hypothetical protein
MQLVKILALLIAVAWFQKVAIAEDNVKYHDNLLIIPSVDISEQVGRFKNVVFELNEQGIWLLRDYQETLKFTYIDNVNIVTTDSFPVQVFLQVSGHFIGCGGLGAINKRLVGEQFEISINEAPGPDPMEFTCTADIKPFKTTIALPVYGLEAGIYSYKVNGRDLSSGEIISPTGTFELKKNNDTNEFTSFEERFYTVQNGISRQEVIKILGVPQRIKNLKIQSTPFCIQVLLDVGSLYEQWEYGVDSSSQGSSGYVIWFSKSNTPSEWKTVGKGKGMVLSCI